MLEALQYEFMRNALAAGLLLSIACGIIGTLVVVNRMVFISGGVAHAAYGGIGIAFFLGIPPLLGAGLFSVISALVMGALSLRHRHRTDTIIGAVWAFGMALGVILIDMTPGYGADLMSYLFGSILTVPRIDLFVMLGLDVVVAVVVFVLYKDFLSMSYDEEFARLRGVPVRLLYFLLLVLASLTVVMTIRAVGLILVIALLTIPQFIAERFSRSLAVMMAVSSALGATFTVAGLWLSFVLNLTSGATIIMVASVALFLFITSDKLAVSLRHKT